MSRQRVLKRWMPAIALVLLPLLRSIVVRAAPAAVPMLSFAITPTPTFTLTITPTPEPTATKSTVIACDPVIRKEVDPPVANSGDVVTFTIKVQNNGAEATVNGHVVDTVPDYLEILAGGITAKPEHQVRELPIDSAPEMDVNPKIDGQQITVYLKPLSHGDEVTIVILTKLHVPEHASDEVAPGELVCVDNVAHFYTDNCGDPGAQAAPCWLPETGRTDPWWMLAAGLSTTVLVLSLSLSKRWRADTSHRT